jgi:hypothetical protein
MAVAFSFPTKTPSSQPRRRNFPAVTKSLVPHPKINFKTLAHFSPPKNASQFTTFTTHFTTISPQKNHTQPPTFSKTPSKTPAKTRNPGSLRGSIFFAIPEQKN